MVEGILIHKVKFKERDIIAKILTRDGIINSFYFYGGQGGGKSIKPSLLEVGRMFSVLPTNRKASAHAQSMIVAKEWKVLWDGRKIREDFNAFSLMSFVLELVGKIGVEDNTEDVTGDFKFLFNSTSNFLFHLNEDDSKILNTENHLVVYLIKLITQLGIMPVLDHCLHCDKDLSNNLNFILDNQNGGFSCSDCFDHKMKLPQSVFDDSRNLRELFYSVNTKKYSEVFSDDLYTRGLGIVLIKYLFYHYQFQETSFKTLKFLNLF